jgi:CubicO group peptidase (beta-lactamase class C family)
MQMDTDRIAAIVRQHEAESGFSGVILLRSGGEVVLSEACGMANRSAGVPNTMDTRFGIASGTKSFTGLGVCRLIEMGKLALGTRLVDCAGHRFTKFSAEITVGQLLTHCSGIPDYADEEDDVDYAAIWNTAPSYLFRRPADFLPLFADREMKYRPGERFHYNNAGYILLGLIIENVAALGYHDYMAQQVFLPAGMQDTGFFELDRLPTRTALGYISGSTPGQWRTNIFSIPIKGGPDGGLFTTAADLLGFYDALVAHRLLSPQATAEFLSPQIATAHALSGEPGRWPQVSSHYGYGMWMEVADDQVQRMTISGGDPGAECFFDIYPGLDLQAIYLANGEGAAGRMRREICEALELPGHVRPAAD